MGRRPDPRSDGTLVARLYGTAGRHASSDSSDEEAIAELRGITTRPDLLGRAAGLFSAAGHPWPEWGRRAVRLLLAAGADREVMAATERQVRGHLSRRPLGY